MEIFRTPAELQAYALSNKRAGRTIALVPTMGYLHAGHCSLIDIARQKADLVIVSIFVNPIQFGPSEDLDKYPRDFEHDAKLCTEHGADAVFAPEPGVMYAPDASTVVEEQKLSRPLCGARRPGHFRGVTTVVAKLFNLALPDYAVFGMKDAQQLLVIRRMVRDLNFPVEIVAAPLIREHSGLALSSRNTLLDTDHRTAAPYIYKVLKAAVEKSHQTTPDQLAAWVTAQVESNPLLKVIYFQVVDAATMQQVRTWEESPAIQGCIAVQAGDIRLIDNIKLR